MAGERSSACRVIVQPWLQLTSAFWSTRILNSRQCFIFIPSARSDTSTELDAPRVYCRVVQLWRERVYICIYVQHATCTDTATTMLALAYDEGHHHGLRLPAISLPKHVPCLSSVVSWHPLTTRSRRLQILCPGSVPRHVDFVLTPIEQ